MLALSLWQPWAFVVTSGPKRVENRTWAPSSELVPIGTRFAIHASLKYDMPSARAIELDHDDVVQIPAKQNIALGAVVGVATLVRVVRSLPELLRVAPDQQRWWQGPVGFVLEDVLAIEHVPVSGARGFWTLPPDVELEVVRRQSTSRRSRRTLRT